MKHLQTLLAATSLFAACSAAADPFADVAQLDVLPGWQTPDGTHMAAIRVTLQPGWKTYWRSPGDAGIPPQFSWGGSDNIAGAEFHWPTPSVIEQNTLRAIGYHESLVLPVEIAPVTPGAPITMAGEVVIGVCEDICIPMTLPFSAELPVAGSRDTAIVAALLNQPLSPEEAGLTAATCQVTPGQGRMQLTAEMTLPPAGSDEAVAIETGNPELWVSAPDVTREGDQLMATVNIMHVYGTDFALDRSDLRITVLGSDYAVDVQGCNAG